jgi:tRNA(Ile2) C34 agmatinyltransferase TiaS
VSFVENGKKQLDWIASPLLQRSLPRIPGCVHCGSRLEMNGQGKFSLSGKCDNCAARTHDDDAIFDDNENEF